MAEASHKVGGEESRANLDSLLTAMPIPLSSLVEITGVKPDFDAVQAAIQFGGTLPLGYIDLYKEAVKITARDKTTARHSGDPRARQYSVEQWMGEPDVRGRLTESFEPLARRVAITNNLARFVTRPELPWRDYQQETAQKTLKLLLQGQGEFVSLPNRPHDLLARYGYGDLPTGSGKTVSMALIADGTGVGQSVSPVYDRKIRLVIAGPTLNILDQTVGDYVRGFAHFAPHIQVSRLDRNHRGLDDDWDALVTTYNSLDKLLGRGVLQALGVDLLFLDEAHHVQGKRRSRLVTASGVPTAIGFTATPDFSERRLLRHVLPNKINEVSLIDLINRGTLSGIHILELATQQEFTVTGMTPDGNFLADDLERLAQNQSRNNFAIKLAKDFVASGYQGAISCLPGAQCLHARELAAILDAMEVGVGESKRRINAAAIGSFLPPGERKQILEQFEAGEIDILTYVDYLNEGWDSDAIDFLLITNPTASLRVAKQRIGRLTRRKEEQPVKWVVELLDDEVGIGQVTATKALGLMDVGADFVIGDEKARAFLDKTRRAAGRSTGSNRPFPLVDGDVRLRIESAQLTLVEMSKFEAVREAEFPQADWPSLSELYSLRPDLSRGGLNHALESSEGLYEQRVRCRSRKGNNLNWEIYFPPEARQQVIDFEMPPIAGTDMIPVSVGAERLGISMRKMDRALGVLPTQGTIRSPVNLRSKLSYKIVPHLNATDLPAIEAYLESEAAGSDVAGLHSLAVLLGCSDRIIKDRTIVLGLDINDLDSASGTRGHFVTTDAAVALATQFPRAPERPSRSYLTKTELMVEHRMGKHTLEDLCSLLDITPDAYMISADDEYPKPFVAPCYSPDQIAEILRNRPNGQGRPRRHLPAGKRQTSRAAGQPETTTSQLPPGEQVAQVLTTLLRTSNGVKHLPGMLQHFLPQRAESQRQTPDRGLADLLHTMSVLFYHQQRQTAATAKLQGAEQTDWIGPLALRHLLGSRSDSILPHSFEATLSAMQKSAAARRQKISADEILAAVAAELRLFMGRLSRRS